ncbi:MAG TPA: class E sortase [Actinomycetota bacterium]|jgi:sortase A
MTQPSRAKRLAEALRSRPGPRRALNVLSVLLLVGGIVLFAQPFVTDLWAKWKQSGLEDELGTAGNRKAFLDGTLKSGDPLTRMRIPRLGLNTVVVEGASLAALRAGSGHYPGTALPCAAGNTGIAGHRTTYSKPFAHVDDLKRGDKIVLETPVGRCTYLVHETWITHPADVSVLEPHGKGSWLTLTTCNPPGSDRERLIVKAKLVEARTA